MTSRLRSVTVAMVGRWLPLEGAERAHQCRNGGVAGRLLTIGEAAEIAQTRTRTIEVWTVRYAVKTGTIPR